MGDDRGQPVPAAVAPVTGTAYSASTTNSISPTSTADGDQPRQTLDHQASVSSPTEHDLDEKEHLTTSATGQAKAKALAATVSDDDEKQHQQLPASSTPAFEYNPGHRKFEGKHREKWWQVWRPKDPPLPPPASLDDATLIPLANASWVNKLFFHWMTPMMVLGYQRPLEATDLWVLHDDLSAKTLSTRLQQDWERRVVEANEYNRKLETGELQPGWRLKTSWALKSALGRPGGNVKQREADWRAPLSKSAADAAGAIAYDSKKMDKSVNPSGHKKPSLVWALHDQFGWTLWSGLSYKIIGDTAQITSPLVLKEIIRFAQEKYAAEQLGIPGPNIGKGIGLAFGLFFMQALSSLCTHQFFWNSMSVGVESRAALISAIFKRAMKMNGKARSSGKLVNHISTDCSRIDFAAAWFTIIFAAPLQMIICLVILIVQIGPSALAGFAVFLVAGPFQTYTMKALFTIRRASMRWTDQRAKTLQEVLGGMRIVKSFSHESNFLRKIYDIRNKELIGIRKILIIRSANNAIASSLPVLAAVVAFIIYSTKSNLDPATIFPSLTLFQLLRMPLMFLPLCLSATTDALNAIQRIQTVFTAEQLEDTAEYDEDNKFALIFEDASFRWELSEPEAQAGPKGGPGGPGGASSGNAAAKKGFKGLFRKAAPAATQPGLPPPATAPSAPLQKYLQAEQAGDANDATVNVATLAPKPGEEGFIHPDDGVARSSTDNSSLPKDGQVSGLGAANALVRAATRDGDAEAQGTENTSEEEPFSMNHLNIRINKGELVAIVGPVGSGKSSFLQAAIGEMRKTGGTVKWGSERVAYCSQSAWIQNATLRDNVLFGQPFDEERYWEAIRVSELETDLAILPAGDMTEIGEKGVTLSGGQKQRVNIARALYYGAPIVCLDDPLSAVDAHVGKALFYNAIMGLKQKGVTVLLVTHALHFLPDVDRIITLLDGHVVETGTYPELSTANGPFQRLVEEFGGEKEEEEEKKVEEEEEAIDEETEAVKASDKAKKRQALSGDKGKKAGQLMEAEERNTGSVSAHVYLSYFKFGHGLIMVPICLLSVALMQATTIINSYWLIWWQQDSFNQSQGFYMGIYAGLAVAATFFTFVMGTAMGFLSYYSCRRLHADALKRVIFAPMAWLDVTPIGRIMNRFSKDVDVVDNQLADAIRMATFTFAAVIGAIILITILTHYFVIAVAFIMVFYFFGALFYRSSAREVKRLDAILRSSLYSHFSETLSGLATIRAYRETDSFVGENVKRMDVENRAYYLSITNQRWLGIRLDLLGALLVLIVAILTTAGATSITGGQAGIALSYMLTVSQAFSWMTRQVAEVENDSASVERLLHYAESLDQEAAQERADNPVREAWPESGSIEFDNIWLSYRPGLPSVLKGISFRVGAGEKVGIVGRTGAGKSSLLTALLRLTELSQGKISIDGVDVSQIGLQDLRRRLAILPQDPLLFSGTLRSNLDPFGVYDDARLNDALKRAYLISDDPVDGGAATPASIADGSGSATPKAVSRLRLDTVVEEEGSNLSVGQRSLVSLARALVKNSQIILLDEATASVDLETDAKIQATIREEFATRTILCIAHRLRTILAYDRIAVFDKGELAEYDSPLALYDRSEGIFHAMCERSHITREEIVRSRALAAPAPVSYA